MNKRLADNWVVLVVWIICSWNHSSLPKSILVPLNKFTPLLKDLVGNGTGKSWQLPLFQPQIMNPGNTREGRGIYPGWRRLPSVLEPSNELTGAVFALWLPLDSQLISLTSMVPRVHRSHRTLTCYFDINGDYVTLCWEEVWMCVRVAAASSCRLTGQRSSLTVWLT